jgi:cytochrome c-type biogenesis protein CcmH
LKPGRNILPWAAFVFCVVLVLNISLALPVHGQGTDESLEREAQAIDRMIMCPVCPAETIDQAQVEISFQMRSVIREMLAEGRTREEILDYFVDRYGPDILAAPPKSGANLLAWILPIAGVAAGLVAVFLVIRSMTGRRGPVTAAGTAGARPAEQDAQQPDDTVPSREMAPYLEIADRLLASRSRSQTGPTGQSVHLPDAAPSGFPEDENPKEREHTHTETPPEGEGTSHG